MTAYVTGTATNAADFFTKLQTFLKTSGSLVSASQAWTQPWTSGGDIVLQGPGLSGSDQVMIGLRLTSDVSANKFILWMNGMTGVVPGATAIEGHANVSPNVAMYLDSSPMTYWFVANGRRFVAVAQIATVFQALYGGLFLPYGTPSEYPYPLLVGGSRGDVIDGADAWTSSNPCQTMFVDPQYNPPGTFGTSSLRLLDPAGQWLYGANSGNVITETSTPLVGVGPRFMFANLDAVQFGGPSSGAGYGDLLVKQRDSFGGGYAMTPLTLVQNYPAKQTFGILDGLYFAPAFGNSAGDIINAASTDHLVIANVFRASDLWALALG